MNDLRAQSVLSSQSNLESFQPPTWWSNPHLQTIARGLKTARVDPQWERIHLASHYGDHLKVDCRRTRGEPKARLLVLHGLTGCSYAPPTPEVAIALSELGVETWALNLRGADRIAPEIPRLYHAGCSEDLDAIFSQMPRDKPWRFVGYSMGANLLLKWLGENPEQDLAGAKAMAVSCPFDIGEVAKNLEKTRVNRMYRVALVYLLKQIVKKFSARYPEVISKQTMDSCRTFPEFDQTITAPLHGFPSAEDYWEKCSCTQFLTAIKVPTILLHAHDDPFQPNPPTWIESPYLQWEIQPKGGHLGFLLPWSKDWLAQQMIRFALS